MLKGIKKHLRNWFKPAKIIVLSRNCSDEYYQLAFDIYCELVKQGYNVRFRRY